jgi:hypothetical protein
MCDSFQLQWEKLQMTTSERRKIFCSVTFHVIAITCVVWSLYVLIDRTAEEIKQGNDNGKNFLFPLPGSNENNSLGSQVGYLNKSQHPLALIEKH